jgi:hypothetical protein
MTEEKLPPAEEQETFNIILVIALPASQTLRGFHA